MGVELSWVRYGRDAVEALRAAVTAAKGDEPLAPVTVVVPSNGVGVAARRLLATGVVGPVSSRGRGLAAVGFLTVYRLAELLGAAALAGAGRRPVSTPVIAAALRGALAEDAGVFREVASHPSTEAALLEAYRELRDCSPGALDALAGRSRRAADVVRLTKAVRSRLAGRFFDEEDLIETAVARIGDDDAALRGFGPVVLYLPERLSRHGAALLGTVGRRAGLQVMAGTTGDPGADDEVVRSLRRLLGGEEPPGPPSRVQLADVVSPGRTRVETASDADEEVRAGVRAVLEAVTAGTPLDRIALCYASPEPYARLVHDQLSAAGVVYNGAAVMTPAARGAGRTLLGLLGLPERGFRRDDVFAWLAGARIRHERGAVPVGAWERISRDAGVVGRGDWDRRLTRYADEREAELAQVEADPEAPPWRAERLRREADQARALRGFVVGWMEELERQSSAPRPWPDRARWARHVLGRLLGGDAARAQWPLAEQRAAERVERALDRLGGLDEVEGAVSLEVFVRTLALELDADLGRVGRIGEGVLAGSVGMAVGQDLDVLVVLGLVEGSFPAPVRDDSLLPDSERAATGDELGRRSHIVERQHRQLLAALAGAATQVLCVPRGDLRRSSERVPSRWALEIASLLEGERLWSDGLLAARSGWARHHASYDHGLRTLARPATAQEHRLRALLAAGPGVTSEVAVPGDAVLAAGASLSAARRSDRFTRYDGNLHGLEVPSPAEGSVSSTALEGWASCPFAYLARQILRVEEVERPEERLRISPLEWGSLLHEVLERFIGGVLERPAEQQPAPEQPWNEEDAAWLHKIAEEVCSEYEARGLVGRDIFWRQDRRHLLADLDRFLRLDSEHRAAHGTRPVAAELAFGVRGAALGTVALPIPGGRSVSFRGKADRVDARADGTLEVVDYKTGRRDDYSKLSPADPDLGGRKLQLPVYGLAARAAQASPDVEVRSEYWFTSRKGGFARVGYWITPAVLDHVGRTVGQMVAGIEAGVFPLAPTEASTATRVECAYCDPDALGVVDLRRQVARKQGDPALRLYLSLGEPDDDTGEAPGDGAGAGGADDD